MTRILLKAKIKYFLAKHLPFGWGVRFCPSHLFIEEHSLRHKRLTIDEVCKYCGKFQYSRFACVR